MDRALARRLALEWNIHMSFLRSHYWLFVVLGLLLGGLQYRLWVGDGSLAQVTDLKRQISEQQRENERLHERNRILEAEVRELKKGMETVEERARHELGMVKEGETLYQLTK
ncbi:cell division protein FtsB [Azotobacter chroococcum]|jgi:cell division protein FtsB|uniref:Cell division protein FtsB n=2 Tax=Azotobacter chroococcum TaxID=353 RepID=A0A4R1PYP5_9GAMM|nr:cell division protein FtsB [Azotobacter chroococcum]